MAMAKLRTTATSNSGVGLGTSSGPETCTCGSGIGGPGMAREERGDQFVQLGQQRLVAGAGIGGEFLCIERQIEEKGLDFLLGQIFPKRAVAHFADIIRVEGLLKLVFDRNGEIRLAQVQRLTDERKAAKSDPRATAGQILQEARHAGFFEQDVALLAFAAKSIGDEFVPNLFEKSRDRKSTRLNSSHIPLS